MKYFAQGRKFRLSVDETEDLVRKAGKTSIAVKKGTQKSIKFVNGQITGEIKNALKTEPGTAFFWSGCAKVDPSSGKLLVSGDEVAAEIASKCGGTTLETQIKVNNIEMPKWDFDVPESIKAWEDTSAAYAKQVSGDVRAIVGKNLREGNIWENVELPRLMQNPNVSKITTIDPDSMAETVIFERKAGTVYVKPNETLIKNGEWDEILENLKKSEYKIKGISSGGKVNVELINEVQKSAKFKNATKYLDDIIIDNGKANPSKLKEIRLALEKGEFSYEEVSEIYNTMCRLNISDAYEKELIEHMDFGKYLSKMVGEPPANMCNPHAHHILFKVGNGAKQKELVKQGQEILRKYGIDPIAGNEILCWAPNKVVGQHSYDTLKELVDDLQFLDELKLPNDIKYKRIGKTLESFKRKAAKR